jgi:ADP-heptose:LPS heptosyltransferase
MNVPAIKNLLLQSNNYIIIIFKSNAEIELFKKTSIFSKRSDLFILYTKKHIIKVLYYYFKIEKIFLLGNKVLHSHLLNFLFPFAICKSAHPYIYKRSCNINIMFNPSKLHKTELYSNLVSNNTTLSEPRVHYFYHNEFILPNSDKTFHGKNITFAVGSGLIEKHKRWSAIYYVRLINYLLRNTEYNIYFVGSQPDSIFIQKIMSSVSSIYTERLNNLVNKTCFDDLFSLFLKSDLIIGTDNGLIHLANACNRPILTIFGPTDPNITGPRGESVEIFNLDLTCSPCYAVNNNLIGCGNNLCMNNVTDLHLINTLHYKYSHIFNNQ